MQWPNMLSRKNVIFVEQFDKANIELNSIFFGHIQKYYLGVSYSSQAGYKPIHLRLQWL